MISINTNKTLNIILPNTNSALREVLKGITPQELQSLSKGKDLESIMQSLLKQSTTQTNGDKTLLKLLKQNPTLQELSSITSSTKELLNTLKQEKAPLPLQKQLQTFLSDMKEINQKNFQTKVENSGIFLENKIKKFSTPLVSIKESLTQLSQALQGSKLPNVQLINKDLKALLSSDFFTNISNDAVLTKPQIENKLLISMSNKIQNILDQISQRQASLVDKNINPKDVLFTSKTTTLLDKLHLLNKPEQLQIQTALKELTSQDFKAVLLKSHEDISASQLPNKQEILKQLDKLLLSVDYHQLVSHLSNASSLYIPYSWDALEDGNITMKSTKDDKFFTDIQLKLKDYGILKLRLGMFEKNQLNINIQAQNPKLKTLLLDNIAVLKKQLIDVGVTPLSIRFIDEDIKTSTYDATNQELNAGFEVKA